MLKKKNRLTSNHEFNRVYRSGTKVRTPLFDIFYLQLNDSTVPSKFGFVVSNKFSKVAPKRNKIKRVFREVVRENFEKIKSGYWIVIKPKDPSKHKEYEEINTEFNKVLSKVPFSG